MKFATRGSSTASGSTGNDNTTDFIDSSTAKSVTRISRSARPGNASISPGGNPLCTLTSPPLFTLRSFSKTTNWQWNFLENQTQPAQTCWRTQKCYFKLNLEKRRMRFKWHFHIMKQSLKPTWVYILAWLNYSAVKKNDMRLHCACSEVCMVERDRGKKVSLLGILSHRSNICSRRLRLRSSSCAVSIFRTPPKTTTSILVILGNEPTHP